MTAIRLFSLALFCLLLSACATFKPTGTPEKANAPLGTPVLISDTPMAQKSATLDFGLQTQAALLAQSAAATQRIQAIEQQASTETKAVSLTQSAYIAQTQTAQPRNQTATMKAQFTQAVIYSANMTQSAAHETATYTAPMDAATAARLDVQAKNAPLLTVAEPITKIFASLAFLILSFLATWMVFRPHPIMQTTNAIGSIPVTPNTDDPDTTPPGDLALFAELMEYAIKGGAMGHGSVVEDRHLYRAKDFAPIRAWFDRKEQRRAEAGHRSLFREGPNRSKILSVDGLVWAQDWLDKYHQSPAPLADMAQNMANSQHEHGLHDHFGVLPQQGGGEPTYFDPFAPENTGYTPKGMLMMPDKKDGE